jgi:paraquat-inducible protein B
MYPDDSNITHRQSTKVSRQFQYYLQTVDKGIPTLPILPADNRQNIPTIIIFPTDSRQKYPDNSNITYRESTKVSRRFQYTLQAVEKSIPTILILLTESTKVSRHISILPTGCRQNYPDDSNITYRQSTKVSQQFQYCLQRVDKRIPTIPILPTDSRQRYPDTSNITCRQSTKIFRRL